MIVPIAGDRSIPRLPGTTGAFNTERRPSERRGTEGCDRMTMTSRHRRWTVSLGESLDRARSWRGLGVARRRTRQDASAVDAVDIDALTELFDDAPFGFALHDGDKSGCVDDHLARQPVLVVAENLVRGSGVEDGEVRAVLRDGFELIRESPARTLAPHAGEAIA